MVAQIPGYLRSALHDPVPVYDRNTKSGGGYWAAAYKKQALYLTGYYLINV